jgi:hypothetical protein
MALERFVGKNTVTQLVKCVVTTKLSKPRKREVCQLSILMADICLFLLKIVRYVWKFTLAMLMPLRGAYLFWVCPYRSGFSVAYFFIWLRVRWQDVAESGGAEFFWECKFYIWKLRNVIGRDCCLWAKPVSHILAILRGEIIWIPKSIVFQNHEQRFWRGKCVFHFMLSADW